jgi:hypothetical protein
MSSSGGCARPPTACPGASECSVCADCPDHGLRPGTASVSACHPAPQHAIDAGRPRAYPWPKLLRPRRLAGPRRLQHVQTHVTSARRAGPRHLPLTLGHDDIPVGRAGPTTEADPIGEPRTPPWTRELGWALSSEVADALAQTPLVLHGAGTAHAMSAAIAYTHGHVITIHAQAGDGDRQLLAALLAAATHAAATGTLPGWARSGSSTADARALLASSRTPGIVPQRDYTLIITDPDLLDPVGAKTLASWCTYTRHGPTLMTGLNAAAVLAAHHPLARRAVAVHIPARP